MSKVGYYLRRARELPPDEVLQKGVKLATRTVGNYVNRWRAQLLDTRISDAQLRAALAPPLRDEGDLLSCLRSDDRPAFFIAPARAETLVAALRQHFPEAEALVIAAADEACDQIFDLLGSGPTPLGEKIDWHTDFKTGHRWDPDKYYTDIQRAPYPGGYDIKVPWELSRCQHFAWLGQAYWFTGDEKYAHEFVARVEDWIEQNPPQFGVNWACTMDVAIRAVNWIIGYYFFKDSGAITDQFLKKFVKSLLLHGRHIMNNLEWSDFVTSNHYLANVVGLVYLGILLPELREAQRWKEFGIQELVSEMDKQVYTDGVDFEASTSYHRLVTEFFFSAAWLCKLNGIDLPRSFWDRLEKMFDFVLHYLKPNGQAPQSGDNDSGRLHIFKRREVLDHGYLLTLGALFFDDSKYKLRGTCFDEEALWLFGPQSFKRYQQLPWRDEPVGSKAFDKAGLYIMRDEQNYMIISCGPNGLNGYGGHAHNDKLSFELHVDGQDLIVDPGTYLYTASSDWRNRFRSTAFHNTISVDGEEQNPINSQGLFRLSDMTQARCLLWESTKDEDVFVGEHYGYARLAEPIVHQREIRFLKHESRWKIIDRLRLSNEQATKGTQHSFEWYLHLTPGIRVILPDSGIVGLTKENKVLAEIVLANPINVKTGQGWYSPEYGVKVPIITLHWARQAIAPLEFCWEICALEEKGKKHA